MCEDKEPLLNDTEKKKFLETVEIIHQVAQEISTKRKKGIGQMLKHPLIILLAGSLISGLLVFKLQKQYESTAERVKAKYELSDKIIDEIFSFTGKVLSTAKVIVDLHSKAVDPKTDETQIRNANKAYNSAYTEFISNSPKIRFKLKNVFKNDKINKGWDGIQNKIEELDELLSLLLERETNEPSEIHSERIEKSEKKIEEIKSELSLLSDFVIEAIE